MLLGLVLCLGRGFELLLVPVGCCVYDLRLGFCGISSIVVWRLQFGFRAMTSW